MFLSTFKTLVLATYISQASASCGYGTILQPRAENGTVKVNNFGYIGSTGPANWIALDPAANALCSNGKRQSPINMVPGSVSVVPGAELALAIPDMPEGTEFENLGTTVEVVAKGGNMSFGGVQYSLQQFHFHLPSEHLDNGTSVAMEVHMVWQGAAGQVAVTGFFVDLNDGANGGGAPVGAAGKKRSSLQERRLTARQEQEQQPAAGSNNTKLPELEGAFFHVNAPQSGAMKSSTLLETVLGSVDAIAKPGTVTKTQPLVMSELVQALSSGSFQTYEGSLTTPPCTEGVRWLVSNQKMSIQTSTFLKARSVIGFNSRFPQNVPGQNNVLSINSS